MWVRELYVLLSRKSCRKLFAAKKSTGREKSEKSLRRLNQHDKERYFNVATHRPFCLTKANHELFRLSLWNINRRYFFLLLPLIDPGKSPVKRSPLSRSRPFYRWSKQKNLEKAIRRKKEKERRNCLLSETIEETREKAKNFCFLPLLQLLLPKRGNSISPPPILFLSKTRIFFFHCVEKGSEWISRRPFQRTS